MAKIIDITEKLNFAENPKIRVRDMELEVKTDATTALRLMQIMGDDGDMSIEKVAEVCELLFTHDAHEKINRMMLQFDDYMTLVKAAIGLFSDGEAVGE